MTITVHNTRVPSSPFPETAITAALDELFAQREPLDVPIVVEKHPYLLTDHAKYVLIKNVEAQTDRSTRISLLALVEVVDRCRSEGLPRMMLIAEEMRSQGASNLSNWYAFTSEACSAAHERGGAQLESLLQDVFAAIQVVRDSTLGISYERLFASFERFSRKELSDFINVARIVLAEHPSLLQRDLAEYLISFATTCNDKGVEMAVYSWASSTLDHIRSQLDSLPYAGTEDLRRKLTLHLSLLKQISDIFNTDDNRLEWGSVQIDIGDVAQRLAEDLGTAASKPLLAEAEICYERALVIFQSQDFPEIWIQTIISQGKCQLGLAELDSPELQEQRLHNSIHLMTSALGHPLTESMPIELLEAELTLAKTHGALAELQSGVKMMEMLRAAIEACERALRINSSEISTLLRAEVECCLSSYLETLGRRLGGPRGSQYLETAIDVANRALSVLTSQHSPLISSAFNTVGITYQSLGRMRGREERHDLLLKATTALRNSLLYCSRETSPLDWAATFQNLGNVLMILGANDNSEAGLRQIGESVHAYRQALCVYTRSDAPIAWASTKFNLACARLQYGRRLDADKARPWLVSAMEGFQQASEIYSESAMPVHWAETQLQWSRAIAQEAWCHGVADPERRRDIGLLRAIEMLGKALPSLFQTATSITCCAASKDLIMWLARVEYWAEIVFHAKNLFDEFDNFFGEAEDQTERDELLSTINGLGALAAYAAVELNQPALGLFLLEQGRCIQLREMVEPRDEALSGFETGNPSAHANLVASQQRVRLARQLLANNGGRYNPEVQANRRAALRRAREELSACLQAGGFKSTLLSSSELLSGIPIGVALIVPITTFAGTVTIICIGGHGLADISVIRKPSMKDQYFHVQLQDWGSACDTAVSASRSAESVRRSAFEKANVSLSGLLSNLWTDIIGPATEKLTSLGFNPAKPGQGEAPTVAIIPAGYFAMLPLHAAWRYCEGVRRCFIEDFAVTYIPSLSISRLCHRRARGRNAEVNSSRRLLAIIDPDLQSLSDDGRPDAGFNSSAPQQLTASREVEAPELLRMFGGLHPERTRVLIGKEASKTCMLDNVASLRPTHLHLSCHGRFEVNNPEESGLMLAHGEILSARDVVSRLQLEQVRTVVLSACETGASDVKFFPDENAGLVTAFMTSGTPFVGATLWPVYDQVAASFTVAFYRNLLNANSTLILDGGSPVQAMRHSVLSTKLAYCACDQDWTPIYWAAFTAWGF